MYVFNSAVEVGSDMLELDVHLTKDGEVSCNIGVGDACLG